MSRAAERIEHLFGSPGSAETSTKDLLHQAARALAGLVTKACAETPLAQEAVLQPLLEFLSGPSPPTTKRRLLCHPLFIEGLHALAPHSPRLTHWHERVTTTRPAVTSIEPCPASLSSLGNVTLVILLNLDRDWSGTHLLTTDVLGRIGFPFSDWSVTLSKSDGDFLGSQPVSMSLDLHHAHWHLAGDETPFLVMSREDCLRMIVANADPLDSHLLQYPHQLVKPKLTKSTKLGLSRIRYEPIGFLDYDAHAGLTGGIIERVLAAIGCNSPGIFRELNCFIHSIRGYELPTSNHGVVGSFSDPSIPGVLGVNIGYTPEHEPRLDPFCFTWFGHEMGHSKNYLIDTVLHINHQMLVRNFQETTDVIPRYGRALTLRTLFQVPYVHLYEWALLMDFWEASFRGLPWKVPEEIDSLGDDLALEIEEAFQLIEQQADLTPLGRAALDHFHALQAQAKARWVTTRPHVYH